MFRKILHESGTVEIHPTLHNGCLIVMRGTSKLRFPPLDRGGGMAFFVLPVGRSRVNLEAADTKSMILTGATPQMKAAVMGHNLYAVVAENHWLVVGASGLREGEVPAATEDDTTQADPPVTDDVRESTTS